MEKNNEHFCDIFFIKIIFLGYHFETFDSGHFFCSILTFAKNVTTYLSICKTYILLYFSAFIVDLKINNKQFVLLCIYGFEKGSLTTDKLAQPYNRAIIVKFCCILTLILFIALSDVIRHFFSRSQTVRISIRQLFPSFETTHLVVQNLQLVLQGDLLR